MINFLTFSDSAKFADVARNLVLGSGYGSSFSFWSASLFSFLKQNTFSASGILPVMPLSIAVFFKIFGISDFAVIATSFFYLILTLIFVYLLGKKIFNSKLVGALSATAVGASYDLIHYATDGASESPFIFEIVAGLYFASLKKKWATVVAVVFLILMFFTRPQAFIYILGIILFWFLNNFKTKKAILSFITLIFCGLLVDRLILLPLVGKMFFYSITNIGIRSSLVQTVSNSASDALRGAVGNVSGGILQIAKNIFYNIYNFYKALPDIINPYLFALFVVSLFIPPSHKATEGHGFLSAFKVSSVFMVLFTFIVTAASIPFYRYLHPIIPLVYIIATGTLVTIISNFESSFSNQLSKSKFSIPRQTYIILASLFIILVFSVGQTVGKFVLDSRFDAKTHNVGKPPVYMELSKILKENTNPEDVIVTNLDTWGSWYGERKTVWFPVTPRQLVDPSTGEIPFDAIYLTSYKIDDANYYMGEGWKMIFDNPDSPQKWTCDGCVEIAKEYKLKSVYLIPATDDYEKLDFNAVLLIKK